MSSALTEEALGKIKRVHFIGIGGSGMYPLAQIFHAKGYEITGSDNNETETLEAVRKLGIKVFLGQRAENIEGAELIIYTAAIMADNPELIAAKESGAIVCERADILGVITGWYENALCVCGTHGKTTTSSMLTQIFVDAGEDVSCVIGGKLPSIGGSGRAGKSKDMVCEACEYQDHFLKLHPDCAIILNVDADHLEYFKNIENIIKSFHTFADMASSAVIYNGDDANTRKALEGISGKELISFGWNKANDYSAEIISKKGLVTRFTAFFKGESLGEIEINVPGNHNVLNALAALAAARYSGISFEAAAKGLSSFHGAIRRFQLIDKVRGLTIVDDYAHHPKEIEVTLRAAKSLDFKRVWAVFQPFTYSRTEILMDDFARALEIADISVITDIMGSREKNDHGIYTEMLGEKTRNAVWFDTPHEVVDKQTAEQKEKNFDECIDYIMKNAEDGDILITFGCGDVYKLAKKLAKRLRESD
ncbi:UDP-N-acetylmuramate--L-alanine ligase [Ruminococcus albus]|uniref:UDP-N-acetylmuramate--L-alanine ligase n=1 Tax=Ruminococcus albus (strain ATCC 27210 / DSM 20455 / JCM 14654 / NCDO 2250 / 7) TaxID=697329 RepID=E6UDN2_RUMA7|nr:UDP-N-acetylmuramate--L-alanine ligase [Ruminococcus albus]ADU20860.1 UDP-N-acetylmuramate/alanine ligase [Ruminococcus albus 7 = DSM 20455]